MTGANDFFHLRPSEARRLKIPDSFLTSCRWKEYELPLQDVDDALVKHWIETDQPIMLLDLSKTERLPHAVRQDLESDAAKLASQTYRCRTDILLGMLFRTLPSLTRFSRI